MLLCPWIQKCLSILLSESCVPIKSFKNFFNFLLNKNISFIKLKEITEYDKKQRLINIKKNKDNYNLIKHSGNWALNRHHVKKLLLKKNDTKNFLNVDSQDEFFLSIIYTKNNFKNYEIVNTDWNYTRDFREKLKEVYYNINEIHDNKKILEEYNKLEEAKRIIFDEVSKHPRTYFKINKSIIQKLIQSESFFARKFDKNSNILDFKDQILAS